MGRLILVRVFLPQVFPRSISTNTNNAPQGENVSPVIPPIIDKEVIEESLGVFDNMIYNETGGGNDGRVNILGG